MPRVVLPTTLARRFCGGRSTFELDARNVRQLVRLLDADHPGLGHEIENTMAMAIDGEIVQDPYLEELRPDSEVFVLPKIGGG